MYVCVYFSTSAVHECLCVCAGCTLQIREGQDYENAWRDWICRAVPCKLSVIIDRLLSLLRLFHSNTLLHFCCCKCTLQLLCVDGWTPEHDHRHLSNVFVFSCVNAIWRVCRKPRLNAKVHQRHRNLEFWLISKANGKTEIIVCGFGWNWQRTMKWLKFETHVRRSNTSNTQDTAFHFWVMSRQCKPIRRRMLQLLAKSKEPNDRPKHRM